MVSNTPLLSAFAAELVKNLPDEFPIADVYTEVADLKDDSINFLAVVVNGTGNELISRNHTYRLPLLVQMRLAPSDFSAEVLHAAEEALSMAIDDTLDYFRRFPDGEGFFLHDLHPETIQVGVDKLGFVYSYPLDCVVQF